MTTHAGRLTISRPSRMDGKETITIRLDDEASATEVIAIEVDAASFALALTGLGRMPVSFEANVQRLGLRREHREMIVPLPDPVPRDEEALAGILAPYEVEGWVGRAGDLTNQHNRIRDRAGNGARVIFERWVPMEQTP